jgi:hypothetical protein
MTEADAKELHRLADMLHRIDCQLAASSPLREGLVKAGLALSLAFLHGLRPDLEGFYDKLGSPLTDSDRQHLLNMGIDLDQSE